MSSSSDEARKNYMKEYMRNRYHADKEKSRGYKNSLRYKSKLNISDEDYQKYGNHLADVIKLKTLLEKLPDTIVSELLEQNHFTKN